MTIPLLLRLLFAAIMLLGLFLAAYESRRVRVTGGALFLAGLGLLGAAAWGIGGFQ